MVPRRLSLHSYCVGIHQTLPLLSKGHARFLTFGWAQPQEATGVYEVGYMKACLVIATRGAGRVECLAIANGWGGDSVERLAIVKGGGRKV